MTNAARLGRYVAEIELDGGSARPEKEWQGLLEGILQRLATRCIQAGASLIGHIKLLAKTDRGGYLYGSITLPQEIPQCVGRAPGEHRKFVLTLNALVYGLSREEIREEVTLLLQEVGQQTGVCFALRDSFSDRRASPSKEESDASQS